MSEKHMEMSEANIPSILSAGLVANILEVLNAIQRPDQSRAYKNEFPILRGQIFVGRLSYSLDECGATCGVELDSPTASSKAFC